MVGSHENTGVGWDGTTVRRKSLPLNADHRTRLCVDPPHFNNRRGAKKQMAQQHPRPQGFSGRKWKGRKKEKGKRPRDEVGTTSHVFCN